MTWEFEISGDPWVLDQLSQALQKGNIRIINQDGSFKLLGEIFDGIDNQDTARKKAEEHLKKINALAFLNLQLKEPLQIKSVASFGQSGQGKTYYVSLKEATIQTHVSFVVKDPEGNVISRSPSPDSIRDSLNLTVPDKSVDKVLRLLGSGDLGWVNLYRVCEVVEEDLRGQHSLEKKGWIDAKALKLFRQTANSEQATGDSARHGKPADNPPKEPMRLSDAQTLIKTLVQKWLQEKRSANHS